MKWFVIFVMASGILVHGGYVLYQKFQHASGYGASTAVSLASQAHAGELTGTMRHADPAPRRFELLPLPGPAASDAQGSVSLAGGDQEMLRILSDTGIK